MIHSLHKGFRCSSEDFQSVSWSCSFDFSNYALEFLVFMQFHLQNICWRHLYMRWNYLCTVDRCVHYTYSICMKLDMLVSKNVVSTCKVLFVNLVLCWQAVSRGQNSSRDFAVVAVDPVFLTCVWIFSGKWNKSFPHVGIVFECKGAGRSSVRLHVAARFALFHIVIFA